MRLEEVFFSGVRVKFGVGVMVVGLVILVLLFDGIFNSIGIGNGESELKRNIGIVGMVSLKMVVISGNIEISDEIVDNIVYC